MTTWYFLSACGLLLFGSLALQSYGLKWGLRWTKIAEVSAFKAFLLLLLFMLAGLVTGVLLGLILVVFNATAVWPWVEEFGFALQMVPSTIVISLLYKTKLWRAFLSVLLPTALAFGMAAFTAFVIRPYLYESFVIPTNSMAPTILGKHQQSVCPKCGQPGYTSSPDDLPEHYRSLPFPLHFICENGHEFDTEILLKKPGRGDRILVNKLLKPRRWDIIVFRLPSDETNRFVKRLVGLPGEEIFIRDGAVWINGERLQTPPELHDLKYLTTIERSGLLSAADPAHPAKLGPDEYFVVGDFSAQAFDSRLWDRGAIGHPPYAVPEANIIGVVTHIYWPIKRWRTFR